MFQALKRRSHLFYASPSGLSVAFVNLKPLVPGHVLVVPSRVVPRMAELSKEDASGTMTHMMCVYDNIHIYIVFMNTYKK